MTYEPGRDWRYEVGCLRDNARLRLENHETREALATAEARSAELREEIGRLNMEIGSWVRRYRECIDSALVSDPRNSQEPRADRPEIRAEEIRLRGGMKIAEVTADAQRTALAILRRHRRWMK